MDHQELLSGEAQQSIAVSPKQPSGMKKRIGPEQVKEFMLVLQRYKAGKARTESRIVSSENWWKLRNTVEEQKESSIGSDGGFTAKSGWLHNVIVSKHADAMESFPEPNILPREAADRGEAKMLSAIIPCVLEQNRFENTYNRAIWQKLKTGTGVYKVIWDSRKLHGMGDISVEQVNLLNLYWEPGITDIQKSRFFFHTELMDKDLLEAAHPELRDSINGKSFMSTKFLYDDSVDTSDKHTVIEVYYHLTVNGRDTLQYCKFVGDKVLYATENNPDTYQSGLYDHGKYPYVFDALYPIEGSPCGYGYVDICRNPQMEIDLMKTAFVKNTIVGAVPRYFSRGDGSVNEQEFLDLSKPIVHVNSASEESLRAIDHPKLDGVYVNMLDRTIQELRETSGNTETSTGSVASGVTAASAIAALQEASGKGSRDSTQSTYRAYTEIVELCIELIRQFYNLPRQFRIVGEYGAHEYVSYSNAGIKMQHQGGSHGMDMGHRLPVFDIKVSAQRKNVYTKVSQNELALQFFQFGFFNPQMADQALMCLEMMDFEGKDEIMQKVVRNGQMMKKLITYMQLAMTYAQAYDPMRVQQISQDMMQTLGSAMPAGIAGKNPAMLETDNIAGIQRKEATIVENARARSNNASQPAGQVIDNGGGGGR